MDNELITLVNSFRNTIALNNLFIKDRILRKLEMINTMRWYGFPLMNFSLSKSNTILQELLRIDKEGDIVKYSQATNHTNTNKLLGEILHNAFQASGYDLLLSNVPTYGTTIDGDYIEVDEEAIFDTFAQYTVVGAVISVCKISADSYLVKMNSKDNSLALCNLLNEKMLEGRIIKLEYIEKLQNQLTHTRHTNTLQTKYNIDDIDYECYDASGDVDNINKIIDSIKDDKISDIPIDNDIIIKKINFYDWFMNIMWKIFDRMKYFRNIRWING